MGIYYFLENILNRQNDLVFGGKINLQGGFIDPPIRKSKDIKIAQWSSEMISLQDKLINIAQKRQSDQDEKFMQKKQGNPITHLILIHLC